jgi:hypothetical protein
MVFCKPRGARLARGNGVQRPAAARLSAAFPGRRRNWKAKGGRLPFRLLGIGRLLKSPLAARAANRADFHRAR